MLIARSALVAAGVTEPDASDAALVPLALVAVTVKVYAVPLVKPLTVQDVAGAVATHTAPPGAATTRYDRVADVPGAGAVQLTVAEPLPPIAVGAAGLDGGSPGVASRDVFDETLVPYVLVAVTVNV